MFKKLSKSERKYRLKIINTYHLDKNQQKAINHQCECSYKELFYNPPEVMRILFEYTAHCNYINEYIKIQETPTSVLNQIKKLLFF